jgi:hypothetical protein
VPKPQIRGLPVPEGRVAENGTSGPEVGPSAVACLREPGLPVVMGVGFIGRCAGRRVQSAPM